MKRRVYLTAAFLWLALAGSLSAANPQVTLHITGAATGDIVLELYQDKAPVTVANFIAYTQSGFYNGLVFHRVINNFMIQGGGFDQSLVQKTTGLLAPIINESSNRLPNVRGTLAMARTFAPDTATSQFFINQVDNTSLDYGAIAYDGSSNAYTKVGYCVFGQVISGMALVDTIAALPTTTVGSLLNVPVNNVVIQTVTLNTGVCATKLVGDIDGDCRVDMADFALMAQNWLMCNSITTVSAGGDISGDGKVDYADLALLAEQWLGTPGVPSADIAPSPSGDGVVNFLDFAVLANEWGQGG
jgi:cyclophilin family peptidyl-prolyl cis-trans isomerase